jgi:hypothetical protein
MELFGPKKDEVTWECRRLHNEEHYGLYCSTYTRIILMIKSRKMYWTRHVARVGESRGPYRFWSENLSGKDHLENQSADGRIILK